MPRKRRPDQGPPVPRTRHACVRCKEKRFKCSDSRPCVHCVDASSPCVAQSPAKRRPVDRRSERGARDGEEHELGTDARKSSTQTISTDIIELLREDALTPAQDEQGQIQYKGFLSMDHTYDFFSSSNILCETDDDQQLLITRGERSLSPAAASSELRQSITTIMNSFLEDPVFLTRPSTPVSSSLLGSDPLYKELWFHYTEVLSCLHTPHDPSSNPIIKVLSPAAQSHDPLLAVLLASSLENYRSLRGLEPDEVLLKTLINTALMGVQQELCSVESGHISDGTLATVVALCDFEIVARKRATTSSWRLHLEGAKKIITLRGGPGIQSGTSELFQFLLKWLAYFDVMSSLTSTDVDTGPLFEGNYWVKKGDYGIALEEDSKLDPYMGFLQNVVPYFQEVGRLAKEKQLLAYMLNLRNAHELHVRCKALEARLTDTLGLIPGHTWMRPAKLSVLIDCHDAFVYSTMVHLYRRVEGLESDSAEVRSAVVLGLQHISKSCESNPSEIDSSLLFPLFTFGCEAGTQEERNYVYDRLTVLSALGLGNVDRAVDVLHTIWSESESTNHEHRPDWEQILRMFDWDTNLA